MRQITVVQISKCYKKDLMNWNGREYLPGVGVAAEHVSPSFLVRKQSGGYRLVTAFTSLSEYCETLPTVMPSVDDALRTMASWKYIAITHSDYSFYQIPVEKSSMRSVWQNLPLEDRIRMASQGDFRSSKALLTNQELRLK